MQGKLPLTSQEERENLVPMILTSIKNVKNRIDIGVLVFFLSRNARCDKPAHDKAEGWWQDHVH